MKRAERQVFQDVAFILISIVFAVSLVNLGFVDKFIASLDGLKWLGVIFAGMFFTSIFTTAPSIALLGTLAKTTPLPVLTLLGGLGAMLGDYVIFKFAKDRVYEDFRFLLSHSKYKRLPHIFKTKLFRFFVPFMGALIIASPLPDELGIALIGMSRVQDKWFFAISFIFNCLGVFIIGWAALSFISI